MDLDLLTNGSNIQQNINLLNDCKISWIVFGYTNNRTLNVIETGGDNFEEMFEEFDANKIMYGFLAVIDENSKLKKNVFIYWQGEAASQAMKTMSVQHANIIRNLLKPVHVTQNARYEQDLDIKEIMNKVALASGSNYSCNTESKSVYESQASVKSEGNTASSMRQKQLKELSAFRSIQKEYVPQEPIKSSYNKINPEHDFKSLNTKQKVLYENKVVVQGQNNTADMIKEERQKELSSLFNRKLSCDDGAMQEVRSNYRKINPQEEIKILRRDSKTNDDVSSVALSPSYTKINPQEEMTRLKKGSITNETDDLFTFTPRTYKSINPNDEIQRLRRSISSEKDESISPGSNYKKINPTEEIRGLRSQGSVVDEEPSKRSYERINAMQEINTARRLSVEIKKETSNDYNKSSVKINPIDEIQRLCGSISSEKDESISPGSNYKKINPVEEIMRLRSQCSVVDEEPSKCSYERINAMQEINTARRLSVEIKKETPTDGINSSIKSPVFVKPNVMLSARKSFEMAHKVNDSTRLSKQLALPEEEEDKSPEEITATAQFTVVAKDPDEISFEADEIIRNIEVIDDDWWTGVNAAGKKGMFPANHVTVNDRLKEKDINVAVSYRNHSVPNPISAYSSMSVRALFNYCAISDEDISFSQGEIIHAVTMPTEQWWEGELSSGKRGRFPYNYVERI